MESPLIQTCTEYFRKSLNFKSKSLQSSQVKTLIEHFSLLLNHHDLTLKIIVKPLGHYCLCCGNYTNSSSLSSGYALPCGDSHYFCSKECIRRHSLLSTNQTLLDIQYVSCPRCFTSIPIKIIADAFEGKLEHIQADACDRALKSLLDPKAFAQLTESKFDCEICLMNYKVEDGITLNCNHRYCLECIRQHISLLIDAAQVTDDELKCPNCSEPITIYEVEEVAGNELYKKYEKFKLRSLKLENLAEDEALFYCPGNDCEYFCIVEKESDKFVCPQCKFECCPQCREKSHEGFTCEDYIKWRKENSEADQLFDKLLEDEGLLKCPECQAVVQRISGCQYMVCSSTQCRGKTFFCYDCGIKLQGDHAPHDCKPRWRNRNQANLQANPFNPPLARVRAARPRRPRRPRQPR